MNLSATMKAAIRTGRNNATVMCETSTERALIRRGLIHPVNSNLTAAGIAALTTIDAENPDLITTYSDKPAIIRETVIEHIEYIIQISENNGQTWRHCAGHAYRSSERATNNATAMSADHNGARFRVIEVRQTWTVIAAPEENN